MSRRFGAKLVTTIAAFALLLPGVVHAKTTGGAHQITADVTPRADRFVGFIPVNTMGQLPSFRVYVGHGEWVRGPWVNATFSGRTLSESLKLMRGALANVVHGVFSDRRLTRSERRYFVQVGDFGRDADVLVVRQGHPACAGLTLAQVRSIALGKTTKWSQVAAPANGSSNTIRLIHTRFTENFIEPRFGANMKKYAGKPANDGGLEAAASDGSVAAITSWARARSRSGVCAVPINGIEASSVTVANLTFPGAFPIGFVSSKRTMHDRYRGALVRRYVKFLESDQAKKLMRGAGLLIKGDKQQEQTTGGGGNPGAPGPSQDSQGRPIKPIRDDSTATSAIAGERFESDGGTRWVFEPDGAFRLLERPSPDSCAADNGRWSVLEGWRFNENGGGIIARVLFQFDSGTRDVTIELDNATPDVAYADGQQYVRSRSLAGSC